MVALVIENEIKNEDLDLCSVCHNDRDKSGTDKRKGIYTDSQNLGL